MPRTRNCYDPHSESPFRLSRSKIDMFLRCPRCFYLDRRLGIGQPSGPPFTLNIAVDALLKKEFDSYRAKAEPHPLTVQYGLVAVPYQHAEIDNWRNNLVGVRYLHPATNFLVFGAVDDIWVGADGQLHVVDYKATSTAKEISLEDEWKIVYKRQMEIYQWLLRRQGLPVSDTGYFVYVNGLKDADGFAGLLRFNMTLLSYTGTDDWIDAVLRDAKECLCASAPPQHHEGCNWCEYRRDASNAELIEARPKEPINQNAEKAI